MNEKIVKTIRSRSFVAVARLNRGVADSEPLRGAVMPTWMVQSTEFSNPQVRKPSRCLFCPAGRWLDDPPNRTISSRTGAIFNLGSVIKYSK